MQKALIQVIFVFLLTSLCNSVSAQSKNKEKEDFKADRIKWYSFEDAYQLNKKKNKQKKIFIDVFTEWCGWCKKMDMDTFTNPVIIEYMNKTFVCVKLDAERKDTVIIDNHTFVNPNPNNKRSTHELAVQLLQGRMSYPSYVFLKESSAPLGILPGYLPPKEFEIWLHYFGEGAYEDQVTFDEFKGSFVGEVK